MDDMERGRDRQIGRAVDNVSPRNKQQTVDSTSETAPCMFEAARAWHGIIIVDDYAQQCA
jgi:hypothetical protein